MASYKYVIVGGGMAADAAVRGIRELDTSGSIALFSDEKDAPYSRPPLSKALWKGDALDTVWRNTKEAGVELHLGRRVTGVHVKAGTVLDDTGAEHAYDKLLLATGGAPRKVPAWSEQVIYFRTLGDYRRLRAHADQKKTFIVIGGGFIGSEVAAALALNGCKVTLVFPEDGISARLFPADLAKQLVRYYAEKGVDVRAGVSVTGVSATGTRITVSLKSGESLTADAVVAGLGIVPHVELAKSAGLTIDDGIVVNDFLQTSDENIYAAGDVARFPAPALGGRMRVEHEDNSLTMGKAAGRAMAGERVKYEHLPFFYSDLFDLGYEAVGEMDPRNETFADWKTPFREGPVYYLKDGRVRGVLLWGLFGHVDAARSLIAQRGPFKASDLTGRIG